RSHQVPITDPQVNEPHLKQLEDWLRSYKPWELFDEDGKLISELAELAPKKEKRMGANPHANGGLLMKELMVPDFRNYAIDIPFPGETKASDTLTLGNYLRDVIINNQHNFRIFGPDETLSNKLDHIFECTNRQWQEPIVPVDQYLAREGRVMEVLSEHQC